MRATLIMIYYQCVLFVVTDRDQCELLCKVKRSIHPKGDVMDGTRCSLDRSIKDVCIERKCRVRKSPQWYPLSLFYFLSIMYAFVIYSDVFHRRIS